MYEVTIQHPAIADRSFTCNGPGDLRTLVWGVARAQGQPITEENGRDREMIAEVGTLRSRADINGVGELTVHEITVKVEPADETAYQCEGREGEDIVLLGGPNFCDGRCKPRRPFKHQSLLDLADALDDADLNTSGGCSGCGLEAGANCADCGRCNCDRHDNCKRPEGQ